MIAFLSGSISVCLCLSVSRLLGYQLCHDVAIKNDAKQNCCLKNQYGSTLDVCYLCQCQCLLFSLHFSGSRVFFLFSFFFFFSTLSTNYPQSDPRREEENRRFCSRPFSRLDEYILASVIPLPYFARCFIALRPNFLNTWKKIKITTQWN